MSEPSDPPREDDPGASLPPWIDEAITKSRSRAAGSEGDAEPGAPTFPASESPSPALAPAGDPTAGQPPLVGAMSPRDAARRAALPWIAAALIVGGVALVLAYIWLTRVPEP